jgi:hypothetical protein
MNQYQVRVDGLDVDLKTKEIHYSVLAQNKKSDLQGNNVGKKIELFLFG